MVTLTAIVPMRVFRRLPFLLAWLAFSACLRTESDSSIPVEDFFQSAERTNFQLSPDGTSISFLQQYEGKKNLFLYQLTDKSTHRVTAESDQDISNYFWANDQELVFQKNRGTDEPLRIYAVNKNMNAVRSLIHPERIKMRWIGKQPYQEDLLVALNKRDSSLFDVYRLDLNDCSLEMVARNPGNISRWFTDMEGKIRLAIASDGVNETILFRKMENLPFKVVLKNNFMTKVRPLRFVDSKPSHIYALSNIGRDKLALVEIDLEAGEEVRTLYAHPDVDLSDVQFSSDQKLLYSSFDTWKTERHFFDKHLESVYSRISQLLEGQDFELVDVSQDQRKYLVRSYSDISPGAVYYFDVSQPSVMKLADVNPSLSKVQLSPMKPFLYQASDGKEINAYLTLPARKRSERLPLLVLPHNGPSSRNVWGYSNEVQFFANRGYAVLQVNYRGSSGYGKEFWTAGFQQWGDRIQEDIADGVRHLIHEGIADPERIGIYGFSFGGYSALYGACFYGDLYACVASYSGITNLFTYLKEVPPYYKTSLEMLYEVVGNPMKNAEYFKRVSPVFNTDKIKIPVFLAQGGKDDRGNVNETDQMVRELKDRQVPVQYLKFEQEGHYFTNEENRLNFYRDLDQFFRKNLLN